MTAKRSASKANFTPEEWNLLLESVAMAGMVVTTNPRSGLSAAFAASPEATIADAIVRTAPLSNTLIKAIVVDFSAVRDRLMKKLIRGSKPAEIRARFMETLRLTAALVGTKAPGDAASFQVWLQQINKRVIEASKVSEAERDDAPEWTPEQFAEADLYHGDKLVRRGRPPSANPKHALKLRIDADVVEHFRATGPGWQTRINNTLRRAAKLPGNAAARMRRSG